MRKNDKTNRKRFDDMLNNESAINKIVLKNRRQVNMFLEFNNKFTKYFVPSVFPIYIFHQSIIVIIGFVVVSNTSEPVMQYFIIMIASFILTIMIYEMFRRLAITRLLFGIKKG